MSEVAPDGSPVPVYLALPAGDAPTIIHDAIDPGADILELGSGVGRLTRVLIAYGHDVVAVDDDPGMLAHVTGAETVCADVFGLDLGRRFGAVVLASHFINGGTPADRARLMEVCARHVRDDGAVLVERYPPTWASAPADTSGGNGPVDVSIKVHEHGPDGFPPRLSTAWPIVAGSNASRRLTSTTRCWPASRPAPVWWWTAGLTRPAPGRACGPSAKALHRQTICS